MATEVSYALAIAAEAREVFWAMVKANPEILALCRDSDIIIDSDKNICIHGQHGGSRWSDLESSLTVMLGVMEDAEDGIDECWRLITLWDNPAYGGDDYGAFMDHDFGMYMTRELVIETEGKSTISVPDGLSAMKEAIGDEGQ